MNIINRNIGIVVSIELIAIMEDTGIVVKDMKTNEYYAGFNNWDKQLRKAKIYKSCLQVTYIMNV